MKHNIYGGGVNTNKYGLRFEKDTDLATRINRDLPNQYRLVKHKWTCPKTKLPILRSKNLVCDVINQKTNRLIGIITKQNQFYNVLYDVYGLKNYNHKFWKPDEVFFNLVNNTVYIVEKKEQHSTGSVDEKTFSFVNKRRLYQRDFNQLTRKHMCKLGIIQKPLVEFCALFNSSWWLHGNGWQTKTIHKAGHKIKIKKPIHCNVTNLYADNFDNLRMDDIKVFFDNYDYKWFGL